MISTVAIALFGCEPRKPVIPDSQLTDFKAAHPGITGACLDEVRFGGWSAWRSDDPRCYDMLPAQQWSGLWEHGWEWTNFCPHPVKQCDWMAKRGIWMTFAGQALPGPDLPDGVHRIEFIGRRTTKPGNFGHLSSYEHMMVVEKIISIQAIKGENYEKRF